MLLKSQCLSWDGWLIVDKPLHYSSARIGNILKKKLPPRVPGDPRIRIGHTGTLDPLATGVLIFAIGKATKCIPYLDKVHSPFWKAYTFEVTWGEERTTDDAEGTATQISSIVPTQNDISEVLKIFQGEILQRPPIFSAIHVHGKRAYDLARKGENVEMPLRKIFIEELKLEELKFKEPFSAVEDTQQYKTSFYVRCTKGTYVRSLARDIGRKLGCFGFVSQLRRIQDGIFLEKDAISLDDVTSQGISLLPLNFPFDHVPMLSEAPFSQEEQFVKFIDDPITNNLYLGKLYPCGKLEKLCFLGFKFQ